MAVRDELVAVPDAPGARVYTGTVRAGLGDITPAGRVRLDTIAGWLQDVAYDDVDDAGLRDSGVWVVRRGRLLVRRFPALREEMTLQTFCSGIGPRWAERRTVLRGAAGAEVESVALWVHLDPATGAPGRLDARYHAIYSAAAGGRRARGRLRHADPPESAPRLPWVFRRADCDPADHVNNAAYWAVVEELLGEPDGVDAEIEYRDAAQPGPASVAREGDMLWVTSVDGAVLASVALG
jgi:acyl-ACP thioesterase